MRFLIDAQLPPALARMLTGLGHHAEHVIDIGPSDASDRELWAYALKYEAVLVTKDEDFPAMRMFEDPAPAMIWVRLGNTRRVVLLDAFRSTLSELVEALEAGQQFIELR